ncbi:MAG: hypothetical protein CFE25_13955 [Chitinophagaceae bacterium BSSC1]|jgi:hypothetical protein|nr:MAG: hypothetical protein CFE25_13955 [Chitinophagaceae bacterium BSSC1]
MSNLNNVQRRLAEGISSWLLFEFHCKRGDLFSEKYLTVPVGQILTVLFPGQIKSEINHPHLSGKSKGRPPQLDFVVVNEKKWEVIVETKWIGKTKLKITQIIWDLMRLEVIARKDNAICYFILSGFNKKIEDLLENTHFNSTSPKNPNITSFKGIKISINLTKLPQTIKDGLNQKMKKYPNCEFSDIISCDLPHSYPGKNINMSFKTLVWKVNAYSKSSKIKKL